MMLRSPGCQAGSLWCLAALSMLAALALAIFFIAKDASPVGADHKLGTPTDLTVTVTSPTSVDVSWRRNGEPSEQKYEVWLDHQATMSRDTRTYQPGSGSQFTRTISGLESGAIYHFQIRSVALSGHTASDPSDQVSVALPRAPVSLVTNIGEGWHGGAGRFAELNARTSAQAFRTGNASHGYRLSSVEVHINANVSENARDNLKAQVWSNHSSYRPDSKLHDLTVPAHPINAGTVSFAAPDRPTLTPNTQYWVVIYSTTIDNRLRVTASPNQDSAYGWRIADGLRETNKVPPTTSSTWRSHQDGNRVWLMSIKGTVVESNANLAGLSGRTSTDGSTFDGKLALAPATFTADRTSYTAEVGNDITHVKLTPVAADTDATVTVEGTAVDRGADSEAIALNENAHALTVRVTAEDGSTTKDYTVTVTKEAHASPNLTGLGIAGRVTRGGETHTFPLISNPWFDPDTEGYTVRVPSDLNGISFIPTWTGSRVTSVSLVERASNACNLTDHTSIDATSVSGNRLGRSSDLQYPAIYVHTRTGAGTDRFYLYCFNLQESSLGFDGATIEDRTYTEGHEISHLGLSEAEQDALRLPRATRGFYNVTYSATGLPEGLSLGHGRLIYGTPGEATTNPATVIYTATDEIGGSATLTFDVTVAPPVAFDADERQAFKDTIFEYTVGQTEPISATLPEATGGHGSLTYGLTYRVKEQRVVDGRQITGGVVKTINDDAPGFSFDANTRLLSSDTGGSAPAEAAFYSVDYWAEDENGARVIATNSITVNEAPTLSAVDGQTWVVGNSVSVTLPEAEGGTRVGVGIRYELDGVDLSALDLSFNGRTRTISGTPAFNHMTDLTYTATDRNGVSASQAFTVNILPGDTAPGTGPRLTAFNAATESGRQIVFLDWADMERATSYVVQVVADGEDFPALPVGALPEEGSLTVYDSQTDLGNDKTGHALITGLNAGDYKVRVVAKNVDGVGDWSNEVSFTVPPQPQPPVDGQNAPCDTCGTGGDVGVVAQGEGQYAELIAKMKEWRNDPQRVSEKAHTDRWDRALLAFGETVEDTTLSPMTAAEAQGFADRGWERWVEVAAALREIEGGVQSQQQQGTPNQAPTVAASIADVTIVNEGGNQEVSLSGVFDDADNDALTITAASSDEAIATVSVAVDYSSITVGAQAHGTATVTVTANDGKGGTVDDTFTVTAKAAPVVAQPLDDVSGLEMEAFREVSLIGVFSDADGDQLTITAASSDEAKATVTVSADQSRLTLAGVAEGTTTVTVTAQDSDGNRVSDAFQVEVVKRFASLIPRMYQWRNDPQWAHQKEHTDRWDRALLAFGETVADTSLTSMTANEAQGYADRGWERWVEVAAALREIEGDGQSQQQQEGTPNRAPVVSAAIADATIVRQSGTWMVSPSGVFDDPDGDSLTITAASSDGTIATVSVATGGSSLTVSAQARGTATVTVAADDGNGGTVEDAFTVTVKAAPAVASAIADVSGLEAGDTRDVSMAAVFSDADGDALTFSADTSDSTIAEAFLFQGILTVAGLADGSATITVTAQDSDGNEVSDTFDVSVVGPPTPVSNLSCVAQTSRMLFQWDAPQWSGAEVYAYDYDLTRPDGGREQARLQGYPAVSARGEYQAGQEASISVKAVYELADGSEVYSEAAMLACTVAE